MEESLVFIEENQLWIYIILVLAGLIYLRLVILRSGDYQRTFFGLERERARSRLARAITMLGLVIIGIVVTFMFTTFASPALPISARPTVAATVSLLSTHDEIDSSGEEIVLATPIGEETSSSISCANPDATVNFPQDGESIRGVVDVLGVANFPGFAFYKLEIRGMAVDNVWRAIAAGTQVICGPACEDDYVLGTWDTSLVTPGEYEFRLVVMDTAGNAPMPCTLTVRVLSVE
jgi:hypothetical protein